MTTQPFSATPSASSLRLRDRLEKALYRHGVLSPDGLTLPDFLCAGFRKAGTTWLFENLHHHPDIYLPPFKNVRYFSEFYQRSLKEYAAVFEAGQGCVTGDFSNSYGLVSSRRLRFVRAVMPEVKLLFLLRNPVEREWSELRHRLLTDKLDLASLSDAEVRERLQQSALYRAGGYTAVLDKIERVFAPEQMFVGFYDDITTCPQNLLTSVFTFLGVGVPADWSDYPYNAVIIPPAGPGFERHDPWRGVQANDHRNSAELLPERHRAFLYELLEEELLELHKRYGERVAPWLKSPDR